jgi:hypothetical protein
MTAKRASAGAFLKYLSSIEPGQHIVTGQRGSEENVKLKFVVPLLEYLGFDRIEDMNFEMRGMDVGVSANGKLCLVVECKAWDQLPTDHLHQCLEYTLTSRTPCVLVTSGRLSALYSSLLNHSDLGKTWPIVEFAFTELSGGKGRAILHRLYALIGKESLANGAKALRGELKSRLRKGMSLRKAEDRFLSRCARFKRVAKTSHMTDESFRAEARKHPHLVRKALMQLRRQLQGLEAKNKNVLLRYRSKNIGLEYLLDQKPRPKKLGLVGVYPMTAHVSFGKQSWATLRASKRTLNTIKSPTELARKIDGPHQAKRVITFVRKALAEVTNS